ncbi:MAG: DEAD/DEAH box helicase family protein [Peptococcaceae bacterium]|nr:DEAD/DEAH box helicase family protein [Peptococcaceae bacterium]
MSNFGFLAEKKEFALFAPACIEAEKVYASAPAMCAVGCRKALELAVKWVYSADDEVKMPYRDNLQSLIHENSFRDAVDENTWGKLKYIIKLGNTAVHTAQAVTRSEVMLALRSLFEFVSWIDCCYGVEYEERIFDEKQIPREKVVVDEKRIKEQENLLGEKDAEIERLRAQIAKMSEQYTAEKEEHKQTRTFNPEDMSEFATRREFINVDMKAQGWMFEGADADVFEEFEVSGMAGVPGQLGYVDYVLMGRDGKPLAVIEAKRSAKDPNVGLRQAQLYADCLEAQFGQRPMIFTTNGFETYFWDDQGAPKRQVSGIFSKGDLERLMNRRGEHEDLLQVPIDDKITNRYYQKEAIRAVCGAMQQGVRKHLLVMATGTGKTRTAASLVDVLSRGKAVTNVLFLADRTALVKQAKEAFRANLPDMSLCNLCDNKDDWNARVVFSTYPTMLNAIDHIREGEAHVFTPAHFDLIIIDESHRSIFKKYQAIFAYFDAQLVGLTATPKMEVDRNTYDFFGMEDGVPTYVYDYETAVEQDHYLVPFYNFEVTTQFLEKGIVYDDLSEEDKARYEDDFAEDDRLPDFVPSNQLNRFVFNTDTVDMVLEDLMERGIKIAGGDKIGKTIIFAQNKKHAEFIVERFNHLYPTLKGTFAQRVVCDDNYVQTIIDDFRMPERMPQIAVSVDMMDTGVDVPDVVNLVFFKKVRSKAKFWQMIGRGTRLCKDLVCTDAIDGEYVDKRRFLIFDYCGNFEFFRTHENGYESKAVKSLTENIFDKRIQLIAALQDPVYEDEGYQSLREALVTECHGQIRALNQELVSVKLEKRYVIKYQDAHAFDDVDQTAKGELQNHIAHLVEMDEQDEFAKRFDNFMYGLMLAHIEAKPSFRHARSELMDTADCLERKSNIPQIKANLDVIHEVQTEAFWAAEDLLQFERVREALRELIKFLDRAERKPIVTSLVDTVIDDQSGKGMGPAYDFEAYSAKVNRFVNENGDMMAIHKLTHNIPLSQNDYNELERVLTSELGSADDYKQEYGDTPFGLLVRKIAKVDHETAMEAFSAFINNESLNQQQIAFVEKVINHIEKNGFMENLTDLQKPPFDKPVSFMRLFDAKTCTKLVQTIKTFRDNAVTISVS